MKKNILLFTITTLILLMCCEIFVRMFFPQINEHDQMFQKDSTLGWKFIPNHSGSIVYDGEVNHTITTNSSGFRDLEFSEKKGSKKIMVLGDSFTSNISVPQPQVFTSVLEEHLSNTSIFNFGVNGYGQVQEFLLLKKWLPQLKPDLVVVLIYLRNDVTDNTNTTQWLYPRPTATMAQDTIQIQSPSIEDYKKTPALPFYYRSHLFRFVKKRLSGLLSSASKITPSAFIPPEYYLCSDPLSEDTNAMFEVLKKLLITMDSYAKTQNTTTVFVLAPSMLQVEDTLWKTLEEDAISKNLQLSRTMPNANLMEFATQNNIPMLDLLPVLRAAQSYSKRLYHPKEQHWTAEGNSVVADALAEYIKHISY